MDWRVYAFNGEDGKLIWFFPAYDAILHTALGDIDGDGKLELVISSIDHNLYAFDFPSAGRHVYWQGLAGASDFTRTKNIEDIDPDYDYLATDYEEFLGTNPTDSDTDKDGIKDGREVNTYNTNPTNADTDGDGFKDGIEIKLGTDPNDPKSSPLTIYIVPYTALVLMTVLVTLYSRRFRLRYQ